MYGHIHIILKDLVLEAFGQNVWSAILLRAGLEEDVVLNTVQHPDEVSYRLVAATCAETELSAEDALEAFGRHFVGFALRTGNARFLKAQGSTLPGFLANVNTLHNQLERDHPNALFPYLEVSYDRKKDEAAATLQYLSTRAGLSGVVVGVVKEVGLRLFGLQVTMKEQPCARCFRKDAEDKRATAWHVSWVKVKVAVPQDKKEQPTPRMSFAALHWAMIDFGKLISNFDLLSATCASEVGCTAVEANETLHIDPAMASEANRKLDQVRSGPEAMQDVLLRGTPARHVAAAWCDSTLAACRDFWSSSTGDGRHYALSQDAQAVDVFVSHSWSPPDDWEDRMGQGVDYSEIKSTTLAVMAKDYAQEHRTLADWGNTSFWIDKACIHQDIPELKSLGIGLLEKFLEKCDTMCVIFTWTYLERLWCVYEWACVLVSKPPHKVFLQTELFVKEETLPLYLDAVRHFSLKQTKCFAEEDRKVLEAKIDADYVSTEAFETLVQATVVALMARSMAFRAGRSPHLHKTFFQPWITLARELGFVDLAGALECCRCSDWRKMTSLNSTSSQNSTMSVRRHGSQKSTSSKPSSPSHSLSGMAHKLRGLLSPTSTQQSADESFQMLFSPRSEAAHPSKPKALEDSSPKKAEMMGRSMGVNSLEYTQIVSDWFDLDVAPVLEDLLKAATK
mmetsp:Transcript_72671/g.173474  ORF Transcript_72671/g.173474 Transcript_72671/m.173474 type:complete len:678 (-) Transcript_72671:140-2173(-)